MKDDLAKEVPRLKRPSRAAEQEPVPTRRSQKPSSTPRPSRTQPIEDESSSGSTTLSDVKEKQRTQNR